jgi:hypothetical protein
MKNIFTILILVVSIKGYSQSQYYRAENAHGHTVSAENGLIINKRMASSYTVTNETGEVNESFSISYNNPSTISYGVGLMYESPELSLSTSGYRNKRFFASLSGGAHYYQNNINANISYSADSVKGDITGIADIRGNIISAKALINLNWHISEKAHWQNSFGYEGKMALTKYYSESTTIPESLNPNFETSHFIIFHSGIRYNIDPFHLRFDTYMPLHVFGKNRPDKNISPGGYNPSNVNSFSFLIGLGFDIGRSKMGSKRRNIGKRRQNWR